MRLMRKYTLALALPICFVLATLGFIQLKGLSALIQKTLQDDQFALARVLERTVEAVWQIDGEARALSLLDHLGDETPALSIRWVWLSPTASDLYQPAVPQSLWPSERGGVRSASLVWAGKDAQARLYTYNLVRTATAQQGALEVSTALAPLQAQLELGVSWLIAAAIAILVVLATLALVLGYSMVGRPVQALVDQARRIGHGDFVCNIEYKSRDELGTLTSEMRLMCAQLAEAVQARTVANERLRHSDRLATIGKLASGLAHELGTPLNTVELRARMISDDEVAKDERLEHAQVIVGQCERMTGIIRRLLDFARPKSAQMSEVDLRQLVDQTCQLLTPMAKQKGVELCIDVPQGMGEEPQRSDSEDLRHSEDLRLRWKAHLDPAQMQQVLTNLIVNAVQSMVRNGAVHIGLERIGDRLASDVHIHESPELFRIHVRDQGSGIDPRHLPRLFDPFFTTKAASEGTGLGLAVSNGIVREHGGWIDVDSTLGRGSTFTVNLPTGA